MAYYIYEAGRLNAFFCNMTKFLFIYHRDNVEKEYEIREKDKIIYILYLKCIVVRIIKHCDNGVRISGEIHPPPFFWSDI